MVIVGGGVCPPFLGEVKEMEKRLFVKMYGEAVRTAGELFGMNPPV